MCSSDLIVTKAQAKKQIELRYQMLPYNYTLAFENNQNGTPLMRPLLFEEPTNEKIQSVCETYLWGNDFLIHPITKSAQKTAEIYFPKNNNWFDFYTYKKYNGGTTAKVALSNDYIPTFVRGGSFIPMIKTILNTSKYSLETFDLHFYYDKKTISSTAKLYNDDGQTPNAFEKEAFEILHFESKTNAKFIVISINYELGKKYQSTLKNINFIVHNFTSKPKKVLFNGKIISYKLKNNNLEVPITLNNSITQEIKIQL